MAETQMTRGRRGGKAFWLSLCITVSALALLMFAAVQLRESPADRAAHSLVAARWQQRQNEKARIAGRPANELPPQHSATWLSSPLTQRLDEWDRRTFEIINNGWDSPLFDDLMPIVTRLGDGGVQALGLIALWFAVRNRSLIWARTAMRGMIGVALSVAAPQVKMLLPRYRPPALLPNEIVLLVHPLYGGSFPSGHTMSSFAIATVIGIRHPFLSPPAFVLAALVGLSRISVGVHWPSDVIAGAVIGIALGGLAAKWGNLRQTDRKQGSAT